MAIIFGGKVMRKTRFRKFFVGIYHTILKKKRSEIDFCTRIFNFAKGNSRFSYRTVRLGAPAKFVILHSKIGRRVDFVRVRYTVLL
jgi:hypothetical protein